VTGSVESVVHVTWSGEIGGIERLVRDLAAEQLRSGLDVRVALGQASGPFADRLHEAGLPVDDLQLRSGWDPRPRTLVRGARSLAAADVIHLHGFNPTVATLATIAKRPIVFTEHGNFGLGRRLGVKGTIKRRLQRRFLRHVPAIAANSAHTADRMGAIYGIDRSAIEVIHNGIDPAWFERPATERTSGDALRVTTVGRLVAFKRIDRALEAVARARSRERIALRVVGRGPLEQDLRSLASSLGVEDRVEFVGTVVDVAAELGQADVLLHPSESEPFGLVVLEACSRGALPVVFDDGGGVLEVIPPDGVVVHDVDELAGILDHLADEPSIAPEARALRREWAAERFPISQMAARYADLYKRAVAA
jgi:glycosyltransferase involved in cell wall biosynthesis